MSVPEYVWRVPVPDGLVWRDWGDDVVIYDERNGTTHLLTRAGGAVLAVLMECSHGLDGDGLQLELFGAGAREQDRHELEGLLAQFEHLGLISRLPR